MERQGLIEIWHDGNITPATHLRTEIDKHLGTADIILLLVSADYLASDSLYGRDIQRVMQRYEQGEAKVIPIILRPVAWHETPFGQLQALPTEAKPITLWLNQDEAFANVTQDIHRVIKELHQNN